MKHAISLIIILVLAILLWQSITSNDDDQLVLTDGKRYVEVFMNDFELIAMNIDGQPDYILNGTNLKRYSNSDDTEIHQPVLQLLQENSQWEIVAELAIVDVKAETIQLKSNIVMQKQNTEPAVTIRTQALLIHTQTQIAQTEALVDITQGESKLRSNGMIFNNMTSELKLTSKVNGHYSALDQVIHDPSTTKPKNGKQAND